MALSFGASWVDVCNQALGRLGKGTIADLDEGSQLARYCSLFLPRAIEEVWSESDWTAVLCRAQLNQLVETPVFGFDYYYQLPTGFVRMADIDCEEEDFVFEGDRIATDADEVYLAYYALPDDPTRLPGYLRKCIATRLAFLLTTPLTSSEALASRIMQEDLLAIERGIAADANRSQGQSSESWYSETR